LSWSEVAVPVTDYNDLENKPAIDGTELDSDSTSEDLGLETTENAGNNDDLETTDKSSKVAAINELNTKKTDKRTLFENGDWEQWVNVYGDIGHFYWTKETNMLFFEGVNLDPGSPIVWERFNIDGGGENFVTEGGTRIGIRFIVAWDSGVRGEGTPRTYYTKNKTDDSYTADDEIASQIWVRDLIAGELGRPLPAVATHADLIALTDMRLNDWIYVWDDTFDPGTGDIHVGETWAYAYDGSGWVELVRINEVQIQDDDTTLTIDPVSGKRKVKEGGIGATQLAAGAATDNIIGNRTLEDQSGSSALITVDAKNLTAWLQGFRNNLKILFSDKQDKLTVTGTDNLLTAPAVAGGQPGTKAISDFQTAIPAGTDMVLLAPDTKGAAPATKPLSDFKAITQFTYLVDSDEALAAWANNAAGNDYSSVLIAPGTWTAPQGQYVNLYDAGTKYVAGMPGSKLVFNAATYGLYSQGDGWGDVDFESRLDGVTVEADVPGNNPSYCFYGCNNLNTCRGIITGGQGTAFGKCFNLTACMGKSTSTSYGNMAFSECTRLVECKADVSAGSGQSRGFYYCNGLTLCTAGVDTSGNGYGFYGCKGMVLNTKYRACKTSVFMDCYVSLSGTGETAKDTAAGGWNAS
jgi:hypothetical protein